MKIDKILEQISLRLVSKDAKAVVVGGAVRDHFLKLPIKDYDIEIYGHLTLSELETILKEYGAVKLVGKSFGVLKFIYNDLEYDFSLPRVEKKVSAGHRGFNIESNGFLTFKEASKRRDFTINAMGYDIYNKRFLDPYGGLEDIKNRVLRAVNSSSFIEDPLRLYRAVVFCSRFNFRVDSTTKSLCQSIVESKTLEELPKERVFQEIKKLLLLSSRPSVGFELLREFGAVKYFKELEDIIGVIQDPKWHPEGDVWVHTMMAIDKIKELLTSIPDIEEKRELILVLAVLCHDFGKAVTTEVIDTRVRAIGHEDAGVFLAKSFLERLTDEKRVIESVLPLVKYHLAPSQLFSQNSTNRAIRRLSTKVNLEDLELIARADFLARGTKEAEIGVYEAGDWLLKKAKELKVDRSPPPKLLLGRDLIRAGFKPSKSFSNMLRVVYEMQLDGKISTKDEAIEFLLKRYHKSIIDGY